MDLRYPIGPVDLRDILSPAEREERIAEIADCPARLREATAELDNAQLDTPYRDGGWTVRQVTHHLVDSHTNGYTRTKLALTEASPVIKPYEEALWAMLPDSQLPVDISLDTLAGLHLRWVTIWRALTPEQFARTFKHPEHEHLFTLDRQLCLYAWHGKHHVAHITELRKRRGW